MNQPKLRRGLRPTHIPLILAGFAVVGVAVWLTNDSSSGPKPVAGGANPAAASDPRAAIVAEVPAALSAPVDEATGAVKLASDALPPTPEALAQAIAQAHTGPDALLTARPIPGDAPGLPRNAGELADALTAKRKVQVSSFELAHLMGAILRARGLTPEYGVVPGARFDATELLARRFVVRPAAPAGGASPAWLAPDGGPVEGAVALAQADVLANLLAARSLGAVARSDGDTASRAAGLARRLRPDDAAILFTVGQATAIADLPEEATRLFEKAAALKADAMTWYRLGRQARLDQKPFIADAHFKKAAAADPAFALPHVELAELALERLDVTPKDEHQALKDAAQAHLDAASKADAKAPGIRIALAHLLSLADKNDEALKLLEEEVVLHPGREEGWVVLANVYAASQRDEDAIKTLEKARDNGIETADVFEGLGTLYASTGKFEEGKKAIEKALELSPEDPTYRTQLAQFERHAMNFPKARQLLEEQIAKFPEDGTAGLLLAQLELEQSQPAKARAQVERILKRDPNNKEARVLAYLTGVVEEKVTPELRAAALAAVGTPRNLAELLLQNGMPAEAEVVLKDALPKADAAPSDDEDLVVPVLLVALYTAQGRLDEAKTLREATLARIDESDRAEIQKLFEDAVAQALQARDAPIPPQ